jgi:hypothetical protein
MISRLGSIKKRIFVLLLLVMHLVQYLKLCVLCLAFVLVSRYRSFSLPLGATTTSSTRSTASLTVAPGLLGRGRCHLKAEDLGSNDQRIEEGEKQRPGNQGGAIWAGKRGNGRRGKGENIELEAEETMRGGRAER